VAVNIKVAADAGPYQSTEMAGQSAESIPGGLRLARIG